MWERLGLMGIEQLEGQPGKEQTHGSLWDFHPEHLPWFVLVFGVPIPAPTQQQLQEPQGWSRPDSFGDFKPLIYSLDSPWKCRRDFIVPLVW